METREQKIAAMIGEDRIVEIPVDDVRGAIDGEYDLMDTTALVEALDAAQGEVFGRDTTASYVLIKVIP